MMTIPEPYVPMDGFARHVVDVAGVETVVYTIGSGPAVVFLHGAGTFTGFEALRRLAATHTLIVPYHPGFGESGDDALMTGIDDLVLHYAGLFDRLGATSLDLLESIDLVGFSLGGWIAAEFALRWPERVRKLVLVAPAGLVVPAHPAPDLFAIAPADLPAALAHDPAVAARYFPSGPDAAFGALISREMATTGRLLAANAQGNPRLERWVHRIIAPTLVLWGDDDHVRPLAQGEVWISLLRTGRLQVLPNTGHLVFEECPAAVADVAAFLDEQ